VAARQLVITGGWPSRTGLTDSRGGQIAPVGSFDARPGPPSPLAHGGRARATVRAGFEDTGVTATDLLERPSADAPALRREGNEVSLRLRPFELVTLRFTRA
jgi:hypothetical protein